MKDLFKGKIGTVVILLFTVVLAGVAIFTAVRLYQLRNQPVAPNVPSSNPQAQVVSDPNQGSGTSCVLGFILTPTVTTPPTTVVCTNKTAYRDVATNSASNYNVSAANLLAPNATVTPGQRIVYLIRMGPANTAKNITITDVLPTNVTFVDAQNGCTYNSANRTVTCSLTNTNQPAAFRVSINTGASGMVTNTASVVGQGNPASTCSVSVTVPVPQCNSSCTSTAQCSDGLVCNIPTGATTGNCRNAACTGSSDCICATATPTVTPTATPTTPPSGTPNSCNGTCGSNANCQNGMICSAGFCRNPSCTSSSNCLCGENATATPRPTQPALPQSGSTWTTVAGFGLGILVIMGSLLLAL